MLWHYIRVALVWVLRFFIPAPSRTPLPAADKNAPCPACGHRAGTLLCVSVDGDIFVQHTCDVCRAKFYQETMVKVKRNDQVIFPAELLTRKG